MRPLCGARGLMRQLLYRSREAYALEPADMIRLLLEARAHNRSDAITGLLLYRGGGFMQLLEGQPARVEATYRRIRDDPRHADIELLVDRATDAPLMPGWTMGYAQAPVSADGRSVFAGLRTEPEALALLAAAPRDDDVARLLGGFLHGDAHGDE